MTYLHSCVMAAVRSSRLDGFGCHTKKILNTSKNKYGNSTGE